MIWFCFPFACSISWPHCIRVWKPGKGSLIVMNIIDDVRCQILTSYWSTIKYKCTSLPWELLICPIVSYFISVYEHPPSYRQRPIQPIDRPVDTGLQIRLIKSLLVTKQQARASQSILDITTNYLTELRLKLKTIKFRRKRNEERGWINPYVVNHNLERTQLL